MSSLPIKNWSHHLRDWVISPIALAAMTACMLGYVMYKHTRQQQPTFDDEDYDIGYSTKKRMEPLQGLRLTAKQLNHYDCKNPDCRYLVALLGVIYDVSSAPQDFGPYGKYRGLSGSDLMSHMLVLSQASCYNWDHQVKTWKMMLEDHFHVAGELIKTSNDKQGGETGYGDDSDSDDSMCTAQGQDDQLDDELQSNDNGGSTQRSIYEDADQTLVWNTSVGDVTIVPQ